MLKNFKLFSLPAHTECASQAIKTVAITLTLPLTLIACNHSPAAPGQRYRCEQGLEFTARFQDESVTLDTSRGRELLFRGGPHVRDAKNPHEYGNAMVQVEFNTGPGEAKSREAVVRYPLLPLVVRCVKD